MPVSQELLYGGKSQLCKPFIQEMVNLFASIHPELVAQTLCEGPFIQCDRTSLELPMRRRLLFIWNKKTDALPERDLLFT